MCESVGENDVGLVFDPAPLQSSNVDCRAPPSQAQGTQAHAKQSAVRISISTSQQRKCGRRPQTQGTRSENYFSEPRKIMLVPAKLLEPEK